MPSSRPTYQYSIVSIGWTTSLETPPSSRASRTAVTSGFSPLSTRPFGSCQRLLLPTDTMTTSTPASSRRKTTPPADVWSFTGTFIANDFLDDDALGFRGVILWPHPRTCPATAVLSRAHRVSRSVSFGPRGFPL